MPRPTVMARFTSQPWLMSTMRSTSGPVASRIVRSRASSACADASAPMRNFIARKP